VVDADTGFGNPLNVVRTVELLERAGADALQIEDQVFPKRCGHFAGKEVIPAAEMVEKVKAAVDTRRDRDLLIIARTDAIAPEGFEAAIERAAAYHDAGADVTFVEAPTTMEQITDIPRRLPWPQLANIVLGGRTPELPNEKLKELGYAGVIYANVALQAAVKGMQAALGELRRKGHMGEAIGMVADFAERQRLVHKDDYDALERKYVTER
jgi:2-methylisocitrate lyase-like PEP mutase family enzyme